ncbi:YihY/virulence factor BrkB family protein [Leucobacter sp. CX42]|uniref:YihY/virulence factor BrkB family protein n=1 Tax=unclassified Leucobacter TaxID=2621730 RepID=UPI003341EFF6
MSEPLDTQSEPSAQRSQGAPGERHAGGSSVAARGWLQRVIARILKLRIVRAFMLYDENRGATYADSITYRALFSVFAGILLVFSFAALWVGGDPSAMRSLEAALSRVVPGVLDLVDLEQVNMPSAFTIVGALSLVGLIGAAISAIGSLRVGFREIADELHDDGFFVWVVLRNLLVAIGFGSLLVVSAGLSVANSIGVGALASWIGIAETSPVMRVLTQVLGVVAVLVIDTLAIAIAFSLLSGFRAAGRAFWAGALLGGIGLTVLQELSGLFVRGATSNPLLASFAALIALLLWFNLSAQVILLAGSYIVTTTRELADRKAGNPEPETMAEYRVRRAEVVHQVATRDLANARAAAVREKDKGRRER